MINFDSGWFRNPFAVKEMLDLMKKAFGFIGSRAQEPDSGSQNREDAGVSGSIFTKEDEAVFEGLMRVIESIGTRAHTMLVWLFATLKEHQSDDLRYTVVKMSQVDSYDGAHMSSRKKIHVGASAKGPERDEDFMEFVRVTLNPAYTEKDTRILYLTYLANLVEEHGPFGVVEILIARRVIKRQSVAEKLAEAKDAALEKLSEYWEDIDDKAARSLLGDELESVLKSCAAAGLTDEQTCAYVRAEAEVQGAAKKERLRDTRQGSVGRGIWIYIGVVSALSIIGLVAIAMRSSGL